MKRTNFRDAINTLVVNYNLGDRLGEGSFATVYLAVDRRTGQKVALKCIDKATLIGKERNRELKELKLKLLSSEV